MKVTHPEARRYFMTISEAVSLAVQASTNSYGSEIFVLDMGEQIRIVDLAETMIRLAGKVPYEDIDIEFTGLRPGEKLLEEIYNNSNGTLATYLDKIHIMREQSLSWETIASWMAELEVLLAARRELELIPHIQRLVPEYNPAAKDIRKSTKDALSVGVSSGLVLPWASRDRRDHGRTEKNGKPTRVAVGGAICSARRV